METIVRKHPAKVYTAKEKPRFLDKMHQFWKDAETNRFGIIASLLLALGSISGIAAGFGAVNDPVKLAIVGFPTFMTLAITLAVSPMRWIIWAGVISILADILVFIL